MRASVASPPLDSLRLFDTCLTLGEFVHAPCPLRLTAGNVLAHLDRYHIAEAMAHQQRARIVQPRRDGNRALLAEIKGIARLHPVWVMEPPAEPGAAAARGVVEEMLAAGVKAARLPMKVAPPLPWFWKDLCSALEEHRVPTFLDFGRVATIGEMTDGDIDGVRQLALAHPQLPLILSDVFGGLGLHYCTLALVRRTPNIYLDTAAIVHYWREAARDLGPRRVLFATGAPFADPGILLHNVQYAHELDLKAKRLICGDNMRRLLEAVR